MTFDLDSINADGTKATLKVTRQDTKIAAAPAAGAAPFTTTLTGSQRNAPANATYAWDFGDGDDRHRRERRSTRSPRPAATRSS